MPLDKIVIRGAREHNLKNIDVTIPRDKLVVITGLSGSGKSSLAFDTIFAEGQRRYVESLSAYARQFLDKMEKPDVEHIEGLSPAISIDQKGATHNPRSTVGTVTEIYDYLRLLYARIGHQHCPRCGREVSQQTAQQIVDAVLSLPEGSRILLLAPLVQGRKGEYKNIFEEMRRAGYVRVRVDGQILDLSDEIELDKQKKHTIEVVVDRLVIRKGKKPNVDEQKPALKRVAERPALYDVNAPQESYRDEDGIEEPSIEAILHEEVDPAFRQRMADSLETTLKLGNGVVLVSIVDGEEILFSEKAACVYCGISLPEIAPRTFSFNSPHGACSTCTGLGTQQEIDPELIVTHPELSILEGAIAPWSKVVNGSQWHSAILEALAKSYNFDLHTPWKDLSKDLQQKLLYGTPEKLAIRYTPQHGHTRTYNVNFEGVIPNLDRRYKQTGSEGIREEIEGYMSARICPDCRGARLKPEALAVTVGGRNIVQVTRLSIVLTQRFFQDLETQELTQQNPLAIAAVVNKKRNDDEEDNEDEVVSLLGDPLTPIDPNGALVVSPLSTRDKFIARQILKEIRTRLQFLIDVGLDYLTLSRAAAT
ncbi:MAG: excinuclease ABC subunit UvrA, partial [Ktedonobacteraceae bacterium]|nr:excinuclease ABC subunit UvrA [Ktedonobacteraceae bacterium]